MRRGSLDNHIKKGSPFLLSWSLRMKIALEAAKGLAFVHSARINVMHLNFKTSHILLDSEYNAKLSDLGLAKDRPAGERNRAYSRIRGSPVYTAPECTSTGHLTAQNDVYSFGVVLLELVSGRQVECMNLPFGKQNVAKWAKQINEHNTFLLVNSHTRSQYYLGSAEKAAILASQCIAGYAISRPSMNEVVKVLEELQESREAETYN